MGKKGNWFTVLRKAFTSSSKDSPVNNSEKNVKEKKKWGLGRSKHGEINSSFIPLYREPSSIEKILGDAEKEKQRKLYNETPKKVEHIRSHHQGTNFRAHHQETHYQANPQESLRNVQQFKASTLKPNVARNKRAISQNFTQISAIRIQAAYRGYMARKSYRALKGLVRLQRVMRGQNVKRQTMNTMRCMQLLVKVQSQVRARRLQMMESRNLQQSLTPRRSEMDMENSFNKWSLTPQSVAEADEGWDDSLLTKEERDARTRRKVEAVIKRERALAYAYSHQLLKVTQKSAHAVLTDIRFGGFPLWWNWLDRQVPSEQHSNTLPKNPTARAPAPAPAPKLKSTAFSGTLQCPSSRNEPKGPVHDVLDVPTPRSAITVLPTPRAQHPSSATTKWHKKQMRDDDSLTSCPAFTAVPNYMAPTVSAKAKARDSSVTAKDGHEGGKKRFSFSLTQSIASVGWNKGPFFASKESVPIPRRLGKHRSTSSIGGMSVDSTVSLPVRVGRKPFK